MYQVLFKERLYSDHIRMVDVKGDNHQSPNHNFFVSGAPNDGFLVNTLKTLFRQLRVRSDLQRRYKICICSVILGELESFRNYFPEILDVILRIMTVKIFLFPLSSHF